MHVLGVHVLHCFCMLTEILSSAENSFSAEYVCLFFFPLRFDLFVFRSVCRVCFMRMLYKVYVLDVCVHVLGVRMFMVSVAACFKLILHVG